MIREVNKLSIDDFKSFVRVWNSKYPIDRWWREKYRVPFNSKSHRSQDLFAMILEYEEDLMYIEIENDIREDYEVATYNSGRGDWLTKRESTKKMSDVEVDSLFDNIDIENLNELDENGKQTITI